MLTNEDYPSLIQGIYNLNFTGDSIPCRLLLTGDTAFPVLETPANDVLIAASRYGKGRLVVMSHESYLNEPQFMDFLQNAISWLKPSSEAVIGIENSLGLLAHTLSIFGHEIDMISGFKKDLGVFCMTGYNDSQASEIVSFLREGGGLLIGAQAWYWSECHPELNIFFDFPGNKITSVGGVYFTNKTGENDYCPVSEKPPPFPSFDNLDFSTDLKQFFNGVSSLDITGSATASELLLHGPLTFPLGLTSSHQCFFAAAYYGRGRVVVGSHESFLTKKELKSFILNAISWLDAGRNGRIGVNKEVQSLIPILQAEGISCAMSNLSSEFSIYCCNSYSDAEVDKIHQFVAEGGSLLIAGQAWYWSYSHSDVLSEYPGNKILNKFGISILERNIEAGNYKVPESANAYHFPRSICQLLRELKKGVEIKPPLSSWLSKLKQDVSSFRKLPATPLRMSLWQEFSQLILGCNLPEVSKEHPVKNCSKEAFLMCLAQEVNCLYDSVQEDTGELDVQGEPTIMANIDGTNPGGDVWRSTGLYLPPNKKATLLFPKQAVGKGLQVQVGCQSDDLGAAAELCRAPVVVHRKNVVHEKVVISCVWGGLLYVIVKGKSQLGIVTMMAHGAEPAPTFTKGQTKVSSWLDTLRTSTSPWAELITENIILTVPTDKVRSLEDPESLMSLWDNIMSTVADLASIPKKLPRPERIVADVQISAGWMHAGYPIMCHLPTASTLVSVAEIKKGLWGPIHELGHNQQRGVWEFPPHTTEATCNLWSVYVHETVLGIPRDNAHPALKPGDREKIIKQYLKNGAKLNEWSVWTALETYLQLQEGFGWDPFKQVFSEYQTMSNVSNVKNVKMNLWAEKFSQAVNKNLAPFFKAWGWPIDDTTTKKLSVLSEWEENPMKKYVS
ncbi:TRPM8 channel-associated factor homolog [Bufo bufo]|uniref:TRPM8 channel-associated factor homolog n=1 Tax=Bufo bufo TaxID=8384 RepID=UPI001ABE44E5|nr:TRPM8 channel-associated factor homolog [Bufo bufo]